MVQSFYHVYLLSLGEFGLDDYALGTADNYWDFIVLTAMFIFATFFLLIHLLNMLIAIMGETFAIHNETKDIQQVKSHLYFVLKQWNYLNSIPDKEKVRFLISAVIKEEDTKEMEILENIKKEFSILDNKISKINTDIGLLIQQVSKNSHH